MSSYKQCENNSAFFSVNPWTPMGDQDRISPYIINTKSSKKVMREKKNTN